MSTTAGTSSSNSLNSKRWLSLRRILDKGGPFNSAEFKPSKDNLEFLQNTCKILVIGAGGLGCELLKDLALMGFGHLHVIDMDTIDLSNLNLQFLFRRNDIGSSKAECAAKLINTRVPTCCVTPHFAKIQDFGASFYQQFYIIVCGLNSIVARRWINGMLISMLTYNEVGALDPSSVMPMVVGGTEGFKGNARVILPGYTACIDCTLDLFPPQITYPLCTIANMPRLPENCIEYVKLIQWEQENPFECDLDGDDPQHLAWVYERAIERAKPFKITGVTYRLVQGVIKHIIPAVAGTNAVIAAACATEVFKLATNCYDTMTKYVNFNNIDGIYTYTSAAEKSDNCLACSNVPQVVNVQDPNTTTLDDVVKILCESARFQMQQPGITAIIDGKNKTLCMSSVKSLEEKTIEKITKSLGELELKDGQQIMVADPTSPNILTFVLKYNSNESLQQLQHYNNH